MLAFPSWEVERFSYHAPPLNWSPNVNYSPPPSFVSGYPMVLYDETLLKIEELDQRLSPISQRLSPINQRLSPINQRTSPINQRHSPINQRLSPINQRLSPSSHRFLRVSQPHSPPREKLTPSIQRLLPINEQSSQSQSQCCVCKWHNCDLTFVDVSRLAAHVAREHSQSAPDGLFYCRWRACTRSHKGFNARYKMLVHVRTHTNEKPHVCTECSKSFSRAENLKIHKRSHSGEKPYACPVVGCDKAYSNSSDRFKHMRTHAVEKPYACRVTGCFKRYTDPSSLRKHVKAYKHYANTVPVKQEETSPMSQESRLFRPFCESETSSPISEKMDFTSLNDVSECSYPLDCRKCSDEGYRIELLDTQSVNYSYSPLYQTVRPIEDSMEYSLVKSMELPLDLSTKS